MIVVVEVVVVVCIWFMLFIVQVEIINCYETDKSTSPAYLSVYGLVLLTACLCCNWLYWTVICHKMDE